MHRLMGPFKEGDQALVEVVRMIPEGEFELECFDRKIRILKEVNDDVTRVGTSSQFGHYLTYLTASTSVDVWEGQSYAAVNASKGEYSHDPLERQRERRTYVTDDRLREIGISYPYGRTPWGPEAVTKAKIEIAKELAETVSKCIGPDGEWLAHPLAADAVAA